MNRNSQSCATRQRNQDPNVCLYGASDRDVNEFSVRARIALSAKLQWQSMTNSETVEDSFMLSPVQDI